MVIHKDELDSETRARWNALCKATTAAMQDHCMRYVTPISLTLPANEWSRDKEAA